MSDKLRFDIMSDNFDYFFEERARKVTPAQKDLLPKQLLLKLYNKAGNYNPKSAAKLSFLEKAFILHKLRSKIYIVIQDEEKGEGMQEFMAFRDLHKRRDYSSNDADGAIRLGTFFLANKELSDAFDYLNGCNTSAAYTYLSKPKNARLSNLYKFKTHLNYFTRFLSFYEGTKKSTIAKEGINMPELLVLLYVYGKKEVVGSEMYKGAYKNSFQSSPRRIRQAFCSLQQKGHISKKGESKDAKFSITGGGTSKMNELILKYLANC